MNFLSIENFVNENSLYTAPKTYDDLTKDEFNVENLFWINLLGILSIKKLDPDNVFIKKYFRGQKVRTTVVDDNSADLFILTKAAYDNKLIKQTVVNELTKLYALIRDKHDLVMDDTKVMDLISQIPPRLFLNVSPLVKKMLKKIIVDKEQKLEASLSYIYNVLKIEKKVTLNDEFKTMFLKFIKTMPIQKLKALGFEVEDDKDSKKDTTDNDKKQDVKIVTATPDEEEQKKIDEQDFANDTDRIVTTGATRSYEPHGIHDKYGPGEINATYFLYGIVFDKKDMKKILFATQPGKKGYLGGRAINRFNDNGSIKCLSYPFYEDNQIPNGGWDNYIQNLYPGIKIKKEKFQQLINNKDTFEKLKSVFGDSSKPINEIITFFVKRDFNTVLNDNNLFSVKIVDYLADNFTPNLLEYVNSLFESKRRGNITINELNELLDCYKKAESIKSSNEAIFLMYSNLLFDGGGVTTYYDFGKYILDKEVYSKLLSLKQTKSMLSWLQNGTFHVYQQLPASEEWQKSKQFLIDYKLWGRSNFRFGMTDDDIDSIEFNTEDLTTNFDELFKSLVNIFDNFAFKNDIKKYNGVDGLLKHHNVSLNDWSEYLKTKVKTIYSFNVYSWLKNNININSNYQIGEYTEQIFLLEPKNQIFNGTSCSVICRYIYDFLDTNVTESATHSLTPVFDCIRKSKNNSIRVRYETALNEFVAISKPNIYQYSIYTLFRNEHIYKLINKDQLELIIRGLFQELNVYDFDKESTLKIISKLSALNDTNLDKLVVESLTNHILSLVDSNKKTNYRDGSILYALINAIVITKQVYKADGIALNFLALAGRFFSYSTSCSPHLIALIALIKEYQPEIYKSEIEPYVEPTSGFLLILNDTNFVFDNYAVKEDFISDILNLSSYKELFSKYQKIKTNQFKNTIQNVTSDNIFDFLGSQSVNQFLSSIETNKNKFGEKDDPELIKQFVDVYYRIKSPNGVQSALQKNQYVHRTFLQSEAFLNSTDKNKVKSILKNLILPDLQIDDRGHAEIYSDIYQFFIKAKELNVYSDDEIFEITNILSPAIKSVLSRSIRQEAAGKPLVENMMKLTDSLISPDKRVSENQIKTALRFNNFDVSGLKGTRIRAKESILDFYNRVADSASKIQIEEPKVKKIELDDFNLRKEQARLSHYFNGRHGDTGLKIIDAFDYTGEDTEEHIEFIKDHPQPIVAPAFHGTGSLGAAMILRYGFKVVDKSLIKAGRMLGDGIYFSNVLDKSMQYVGDSGMTRTYGSTGYVLEMDAYIGSESINYKSAGVSKNSTFKVASAEWCVFDPRAQLKIKKVFKIEIIANSAMMNAVDAFYEDNPDLKPTTDAVVESYTPLFNSNIPPLMIRESNEEKMYNITFMFMNGQIPITNTKTIFVDDFASQSDPNPLISVDPSQKGMSITIRTKNKYDILTVIVPNTDEFMATNPDNLFTVWMDLLEEINF